MLFSKYFWEKNKRLELENYYKVGFFVKGCIGKYYLLVEMDGEMC